MSAPHRPISRGTHGAKHLARRLLTGERLVTGLLLVVWGLCGLLAVVAHASLPARGELTGLFTNVGFLFPLLKGLEILLKLYTAEDEGAHDAEGQSHRAVTLDTTSVASAGRGPTRPSRAARRARAIVPREPRKTTHSFPLVLGSG